MELREDEIRDQQKLKLIFYGGFALLVTMLYLVGMVLSWIIGGKV